MPVRLRASLVLLTLLAGCALPGADREPTRIHVLEPDVLAVDTGLRECGRLLIGTLIASPGFGSSGMVYTRDRQQLEQFAFHRWASSPAEMFESVLLRALGADDQAFAAVFTPPSPAAPHYRLDTRILYLRQFFENDNGPSQLELGLRVTLVALNSDDEMLATRTFELVEPADPAGPVGGSAAANRATGRFLQQLEQFLAEQLAERCGGSLS